MGCFSSKPVSPAPASSPLAPPSPPAPSSSEHKLNRTDLVFLVLGPAGSRTALFAGATVDVPGESSSLVVPDHFRKSDIRVRRTAISEKQAVFIVPQEFDGDHVKEPHVVMGVQEWLATEDSCGDHPYVDYILFLSTNPLGVPLESPFQYLNNIRGICDPKESNPLNKLCFVATTGPNGNSHVEVPGTWEIFFEQDRPIYTFEDTSEAAQSIVSKIVS